MQSRSFLEKVNVQWLCSYLGTLVPNIFHCQLQLLSNMEWYSRSEKKCSAISLLTELDKISIISAVRTVSPKLHKLNLHHLHNSCHVFTGIISTTAKVFTKQLSSKPYLKFIKATFSLRWGVLFQCHIDHLLCNTPPPPIFACLIFSNPFWEVKGKLKVTVSTIF